MHPLAEGLRDRPHEGERRTLTVRPGDMHHGRELVLWVPKTRQKSLDAPEREVDRLGVKRFQPLEKRVLMTSDGSSDALPALSGRVVNPQSALSKEPCSGCLAWAVFGRGASPTQLTHYETSVD